MIYGQDEPMLFPVADLYDSNMMLMYINAAREQYNLNREDMKEFNKLYGEFTSPFAEDIKWVDLLTRGRINNALNYMRSNGIDPLRSAEGRALILLVINGTDTAGINLRKENAKLGEEYLKNMSDMIKNGTYSRDAEKFFLNEIYGIDSYDQFNSNMGMWKRTSPTKYLDLYQATDHIFKDIKPTDLGLDPTGKYRLTGVSEDQLNDALDKNLIGFLGTDMGRYYYNTVKDLLKALNGGIEPSTEETTLALRSLILSTNGGRVYSTPEADPYALDSSRTANDMKAYKEKAAIDHYYHEKEAKAAYEREINKGRKKEEESEANIFRNAEKKGKGFEEYDVTQPIAYNINTVDSRIERAVDEDKNNIYKMPANVAKNNIYTHNSIYSRNKRRRIDLEDTGTVSFYPTGHLHARKMNEGGNIVTRYYISGHVQINGNTITDKNDNEITYEMEVTEGADNYGYKVK